jgi:hypothetical protein
MPRRANHYHKFNIVGEVGAASFYRADRNAMASTTSHPTTTKDATAPGGYFNFLFRGVTAHPLFHLHC